MAPEQTYGVSKAGTASDQFSLGVVLYECLVGEVPFTARVLYKLIEEIRAAVVKPPTFVNPTLPPEIDDVVMRALARDPEKRWPSMRAWGAALLPFADEETTALWRNDFAPRTRSTASARNEPVAPPVIDRARPSDANETMAAPVEVHGPESEAATPAPVRPSQPARVARPASREEVLVPYPASLDVLPRATEVRGSVLVASLRALRTRGYGAKYEQLLDPRYRDAIASLTAATWLPIELALAHYDACERLELPTMVVTEIGAETGRFNNQTLLTTVGKLSRESGATPWVPLGYADKLRQRTWVGSAISVIKVGPKEARLEWAEQPCARVPYFRAAFGAFAAAVFRLFAPTLYVREIPMRADAIARYRVSWV
jgi:hypothetical protein